MLIFQIINQRNIQQRKFNIIRKLIQWIRKRIRFDDLIQKQNIISFRSKIRKYNQIDGKIDRRSFTGHYYVDPETKRPRNPIGRTGSKINEDFIRLNKKMFSDWSWSVILLGSESCW
jgi:hypothetical protein